MNIRTLFFPELYWDYQCHLIFKLLYKFQSEHCSANFCQPNFSRWNTIYFSHYHWFVLFGFNQFLCVIKVIFFFPPQCSTCIRSSPHCTDKYYRTTWTYQERNPLHIIHSDSLKHGLSVSNLFKYSLVSLNVKMHTYCYCWTHKAYRAHLKGSYTTALLLPLGTLISAAFPPLKTQENLYMQMREGSMHTHKQAHIPL